jgi:hypothetical protein
LREGQALKEKGDHEMKKELKERIIREGLVDTKNYRYVIKYLPDRAEIRRLSIADLDTTSAIDGWEIVEVL